jgi:rhamnosyltransferase
MPGGTGGLTGAAAASADRHGSKAVAVVVAYRPDVALLEQVLAAVAPQVARALLVVNDDGGWSCKLPPNVVLDRPGDNIGLGAAYNLAAAWAREQGATHLLLLDQDSVAAPGMVDKLLRALEGKPSAAAAGPLWRDRRTGRDGFFVRSTRSRIYKYAPSAGDDIVDVDFLISSGTLLVLDALEKIGDFDAGLFIDHVDTDWTLRAKAKGYALYGVSTARLDHAMGDKVHTSALAGDRVLFHYPPERQYYLVRNSLVLWRKPYAPWPWILRDMRRTAMMTLYYIIFLPPRLARLRVVVHAIRDGLRSVSGKMPGQKGSM